MRIIHLRSVSRLHGMIRTKILVMIFQELDVHLLRTYCNYKLFVLWDGLLTTLLLSYSVAIQNNAFSIITVNDTEAQFIVPDCGEKVNYGIRLRQPHAIIDFIPQQRTMNFATGEKHIYCQTVCDN